MGVMISGSSTQSPEPEKSNSPAPSETDRLLTVPNLITLFRILLIIPFLQAVTSGNDPRATLIFFIAGMSDSIDGVLARALNQSSKIGRLVDPIADKILNGIAYVAMSFFRGSHPAIPAWLTILVLARDLLILAGVGLVYARARRSDFRPTLAGKLNTFVELWTLGLFLGISVVPALATIFPALYYVLALSIFISLATYVQQGRRMLTPLQPLP